jgi:hypothetical protein
MTWMQKAVMPRIGDAYLGRGYDRVAGFVVRVDQVDWATTPAELFEVHGLGFSGSPFTAASDHIDVLQFPATPQLRFESAVGGVNQKEREITGGTFVDRPPFKGLGFVPVTGDHIVQLWWLRHSRIPAGSRLVRFAVDGSSTVLAHYIDVGHGWQSAAATVTPPAGPQVSRYVGPMAKWSETYLNADVRDDAVVVVSEVEPPAQYGFARTAIGRWRREVPREELTELFELDVNARWNGLEMRVVDQLRDASGTAYSRVSYVGHNADLAEGLQLTKVDAGVYEETVPADSLTELVTTQIIPSSWSIPAHT